MTTVTPRAVVGLHVGMAGDPGTQSLLLTVTGVPIRPLLADGWARPSPGVVPPIARGIVHVDARRAVVTDVMTVDWTGEDATALWSGAVSLPATAVDTARRIGSCWVVVTEVDSSELAGRDPFEPQLAQRCAVAGLRVAW